MVTERKVLTRRAFLGAVGMGAGAALLAACGQQQPAAQPTPAVTVVTKEVIKEVPVEKVVTKEVMREVVITATPAPQKRAPVKVTVSTDWNSGVRKKTMEYWAEEYQKVNPHVEVVLYHMGAGGSTLVDLGGVIQTMLVAGAGPDVMCEFMWKPKEMFLPLDAFLKAKNFRKQDFWWSRAMQEAEDGQAYAFPWGTSLSCFVVNVDIFEQAGVKLPQKDWDFNDLSEIAGKLKTDKVWGFERQMSWWGQGWHERFMGEGSAWYDAKAGKTTLHIGNDGGKPAESFADWWGLVWKQHIAPKPEEAVGLAQSAADTGASASALFATGRIAISGHSYNNMGSLKDRIGGRFRFQIVWTPKSIYSGRRGYFLASSNIAINKDVSKRGNADESLEMGYFWLSDTMQKFHAENLPTLPVAKKWWRSPELAKFAPGMDTVSDVFEDAFVSAVDYRRWGQGTDAHPNWADWMRVVRGKLEDRALKGGVDPREMLKEATAEGDKALAIKV